MEGKGLVGLVTESERRAGWIPARRVMELLPNITNVDSVRQLARRRGWSSRRRGNTKEYPLRTVLAERAARKGEVEKEAG